MKRVLIVLLSVILLFSAVSCGEDLVVTGEDPASKSTSDTSLDTASDTTHDPTGFSVGFSRRSVTPDFSVPLSGYGNTSKRYSQTVRDEICVTCVAVSDGQTTALLITQDLACSVKAGTMSARKQISKKTGVPIENILVSATHTHASVQAGGTTDAIYKWMGIYNKAMVAAAEEAIADLDHVEETVAGSVETVGLTYVRRYLDSQNKNVPTGADGSDIVRHETEGDHGMLLIRFKRKNQKDVVLTNFQAHPCMTGGESGTQISADYIGAYRTLLEKEEDVLCSFYLGATGNMNGYSRLKGEENNYDMSAYPRKMVDYAKQIMQNAKVVETGKVLVANRVFTASINHDYDEHLETLKEIARLRESGLLAEAGALANSIGIGGSHTALDYLERTQSPPTRDMEMCAVAFGDIAFYTAGYEMFSDMQLDIKRDSPFAITFTLTCAQEANSYIPTLTAFQYGGYEVESCLFVPGTAEALRDFDLVMLRDLYAER